MDLSNIPLGLLIAEHEAVDAMTSGDAFNYIITPLCSGRMCSGCPLEFDCEGLREDTPGWAERKERYLMAIRAEIERRA